MNNPQNQREMTMRGNKVEEKRNDDVMHLADNKASDAQAQRMISGPQEWMNNPPKGGDFKSNWG